LYSRKKKKIRKKQNNTSLHFNTRFNKIHTHCSPQNDEKQNQSPCTATLESNTIATALPSGEKEQQLVTLVTFSVPRML
jgi:hypothetical protein